MSWHAGNWGDFVVSLGSAIGTVAAAWFAYKAAKSNSVSQEKMDEVKVFENLLSISNRIDGHAKGLSASNIPKEMKGNIVALICVAHAVLTESGISHESQERLKHNFLLMLPPAINLVMKRQKEGNYALGDLAAEQDIYLIIRFRAAKDFFSNTYQAAH